MEVPILNTLGSQIHSRPHKRNSYIWSIVKDSGKRVNQKVFDSFCQALPLQVSDSTKNISAIFGLGLLNHHFPALTELKNCLIWLSFAICHIIPTETISQAFFYSIANVLMSSNLCLSSLGLHSLDCCATSIELNPLHFPCIWNVKSKLHLSFFQEQTLHGWFCEHFNLDFKPKVLSIPFLQSLIISIS